MIGEDIKTEVSLEELRKITWDYSKEDTIGLYRGEVVRGFLWEAKECGDVNPLLVTKCNVAEGWIEYIECDVLPDTGKMMQFLKEVKYKRDDEGEVVKTKLLCKVVIDLLTAAGNVIVTLRYEMDKDTLHEIDLHTYQMDIDIASYAGNAFLADDKEQMEFFKGFHRALVMMREHIEEKHNPLLLKEYEEEQVAAELLESKKDGEITIAEHVKKQMATLKDHDHALFEQIVDGLVTIGWHEDGGSPTYRLLSKDEFAIKVFRNEEAPAVIKICFSAEPEGQDEKET